MNIRRIFHSFLRQLCRLKNTLRRVREPSRRRQTKLTAFRFRLGAKAPYSFLPFSFTNSKQACFEFGRRRSGVNELLACLPEARDTKLVSTRARVLPCETSFAGELFNCVNNHSLQSVSCQSQAIDEEKIFSFFSASY